MPTPVQTLYRLVWGGRLFDTEGWSCSLHVGSAAGLNLAASTFNAALVAWMARPGSAISSAARLDFVKFNQINPLTAKYSLPSSNEVIQNDLAVGVASPQLPQLSLAVSTRTVFARGRAHAGRFYPPSGVVSSVQPDGRVSSAAAIAAASSAATLLQGINTAVGAGSRVVVFSRVGQFAEPVTNVRVGRVMDTMRSRRTSLLEDYAQAVV